MLEEDHYDEIKQLKKKHREELEEEVYQLSKKKEKEKEKFDLEKENCHLKHQLKKLEIEMKCQGMKLPNQPNQSCDSKEDETDDVY